MRPLSIAEISVASWSHFFPTSFGIYSISIPIIECIYLHLIWLPASKLQDLQLSSFVNSPIIYFLVQSLLPLSLFLLPLAFFLHFSSPRNHGDQKDLRVIRNSGFIKIGPRHISVVNAHHGIGMGIFNFSEQVAYRHPLVPGNRAAVDLNHF